MASSPDNEVRWCFCERCTEGDPGDPQPVSRATWARHNRKRPRMLPGAASGGPPGQAAAGGTLPVPPAGDIFVPESEEMVDRTGDPPGSDDPTDSWTGAGNSCDESSGERSQETSDQEPTAATWVHLSQTFKMLSAAMGCSCQSIYSRIISKMWRGILTRWITRRQRRLSRIY